MSALARVLEPEVMDTEDEATDYDAMDHEAVNAAFCDDLLRCRPRPRWVLDLGTGTARIPIALCARDPEVRIVAIDLAEHMLRRAASNVARAGLEARITLHRDDAKRAANEAPLDGAPLDVVCSNSVVHHLPRPELTLAEWWGRTPAGALFFVRDLLRPDSTTALEQLVALHSGVAPSGGSAERAGFDRQVALFRASLHAALRLEEIRAIARAIGVPEHAVTQTSDRHFTLAYVRPR